MGDLHRQLRALADGDGFLHGVHREVGFVADVRDVEAALGAGGARHLDHLFDVGIAARPRIRGPTTGRRRPPPWPGPPARACGRSRRRGRDACSRCPSPAARMVACPASTTTFTAGGLARRRSMYPAQRPRRAAVLPDGQGRDALRHLRRRRRLLQQPVGRVVVDVDEARARAPARRRRPRARPGAASTSPTATIVSPSTRTEPLRRAPPLPSASWAPVMTKERVCEEGTTPASSVRPRTTAATRYGTACCEV